MLGIDDPDKQRAIIFLLLIALGGIGFHRYVWKPIREERTSVEEHLAELGRNNDEARALTQPQRIDELQQRETEFQVAISAYEKILPSEAEVPGLLDDVALAALDDRVTIVNFAPLEAVEGEQIIELPYDLQVQGGYHDIGRFVADIVSLERVIRPTVRAVEAVEVAAPTETSDAQYEVLATLVLSTYIPSEGGTTSQGDDDPEEVEDAT